MPEPIDTRRHFTGMLAGSAARFGPLAIAILLAPLLIRTFGEQRYGAYVLATSVASVLLLLDLGLGPAAEKLLAERLAAGSTAEAGVLVSTVAAAYAALGTVVASLIDYPLHLRYLSRNVGLRYGPFVREVVLPVYPLLLLPAALVWAARVGGLTHSLAGTLLTFATPALLYWMAFLMLMVSRAERDGLIATARALIAGRAHAQGAGR